MITAQTHCISAGEGDAEQYFPKRLRASIMASATPSASVRGKSTSVPEERGITDSSFYLEWPIP